MTLINFPKVSAAQAAAIIRLCADSPDGFHTPADENEMRAFAALVRKGLAIANDVNAYRLTFDGVIYAQRYDAAPAWDSSLATAGKAARLVRPEAAAPLCPACVDAFPLGGVDFPWRPAAAGERCAAADHSEPEPEAAPSEPKARKARRKPEAAPSKPEAAPSEPKARKARRKPHAAQDAKHVVTLGDFLARAHAGATLSEIAAALGASHTTARRLLAECEAAGFVVREGSRRWTRYYLG